MAFHDLNITYTEHDPNLSTTLGFAQELGYSTVALSIAVKDKLPAKLPLVQLDRIIIPFGLKVLSRLTLTISDLSQNHRLSQLQLSYDIIALRPTEERTFQVCCSSLDCDVISLDFTARLPFPIRFKTVASALQRGIRFEICYSPGIAGSSDARRNLISGAAALIRATRGRGIIVSSEAKTALGLRGAWDVINLATCWGMSQERAKEAVCEEAGRVVRLAEMQRNSFRGVVALVEDGSTDVPVQPAESMGEIEVDENKSKDVEIPPSSLPELKQITVVPDKTQNADKAKRKASQLSLNEPSQLKKGDGKPLSKREMKRQAKRARLDRAAGTDETQENGKEKEKGKSNGFPVQHETLATKKNG